MQKMFGYNFVDGFFFILFCSTPPHEIIPNGQTLPHNTLCCETECDVCRVSDWYVCTIVYDGEGVYFAGLTGL